jgi:hypothetical protein
MSRLRWLLSLAALLAFAASFWSSRSAFAQAEVPSAEPALPQVQPRPIGQRYRIHVLTMGAGDELFARFGHIGLVVEDARRGTLTAYNYGTFSFSDPDVMMKYARGELTYWLSTAPLSLELRRYRRANRSMELRTLDLSPSVARQIAEKLELNALPENREYAYQHYLDNCSTRIRDVLDQALAGALAAGRNEQPTPRTYRDFTREALAGMPVMRTVILFALGTSVDRPITRYDEHFLPHVLAEDLDAVRVGSDQKPLVLGKRVLAERQGPEVGAKTEPLELYATLALFALLGAGLLVPLALGPRPLGRRLAGVGLATWGLLAGFGGLVLLLFLATRHTDTHYNENMLLFPVLHGWLVWPGILLAIRARLSERLCRIVGTYLLAALGLVLLGLLLKLGPFVQDNYEFLLFAGLVNGTAWLALRRTRPTADRTVVS